MQPVSPEVLYCHRKVTSRLKPAGNEPANNIFLLCWGAFCPKTTNHRALCGWQQALTTGSISKPLPGCSDTMGAWDHSECHTGVPGTALFVPGNVAAVPQPCCHPPAKLLPCVSPALKCQPNLCFSPTTNPRGQADLSTATRNWAQRTCPQPGSVL